MGTTTSIKKLFFGETDRYSSLLKSSSTRLVDIYPNPAFAPLFESLPNRSITVGPMAMCDRLARDLGTTVPDDVLTALGVLCFHISVHDDLIDEPPSSATERAALLYTGNLSFIEGMRLLSHTSFSAEQITFMCDEIARNHYLQQQCAETLWDQQPNTFADYLKGVQHDGALIGIGVCTALAASNRQDLWQTLKPACTAYGVALQLLDDINEAEEDELAGYHSFPVKEGAPFIRSFQEVENHVEAVLKIIDPQWTHFRELVENVRTVKRQVERTL
jgi:hypothetical protein